MTQEQANMIARSFEVFFTDYEIPHQIAFASTRGVMAQTAKVTVEKRPEEKFKVTIWDQGVREITKFANPFDALFFARENA